MAGMSVKWRVSVGDRYNVRYDVDTRTRNHVVCCLQHASRTRMRRPKFSCAWSQALIAYTQGVCLLVMKNESEAKEFVVLYCET